MKTQDSSNIEIADKDRFMASCKIPLYDYKKGGCVVDELFMNIKANRPEGKIAIIVIFKKL